MGVNLPSVESLDLTTTRKVVPHATSPKGEIGSRSVRSGQTRGKEEEENSGKIQSK